MSESDTERLQIETWPYFRTPLAVYLVVMLPIGTLMTFLLTVSGTPMWMKITSAAVLAVSLLGLLHGYYRRMILRTSGASFVQLSRRIEIEWPEVGRFGVYAPGGHASGPRYIFITRHAQRPAGAWEIDESTIQIQYRDGVLESIRSALGPEAAVKEDKPEAVERTLAAP